MKAKKSVRRYKSYGFKAIKTGSSIYITNPKEFHRASCAVYQWNKRHYGEQLLACSGFGGKRLRITRVW